MMPTFGFDRAMEALHEGLAVRRRSWRDGKYLILVPGSEIEVAADRPLGKALPLLVGETVTYAPHIDIVSGVPINAYVRPWEVSQDALMAEDWTYANDLGRDAAGNVRDSNGTILRSATAPSDGGIGS